MRGPQLEKRKNKLTITETSQCHWYQQSVIKSTGAKYYSWQQPASKIWEYICASVCKITECNFRVITCFILMKLHLQLSSIHSTLSVLNTDFILCPKGRKTKFIHWKNENNCWHFSPDKPQDFTRKRPHVINHPRP